MVFDPGSLKFDDLYKEMKRIWRDDLPNAEQEPVRFEYYMKLYIHAYIRNKTES